VFSNLLDNAAKHGGAGKRIDVSIGAQEDMVIIRIRDYGPGIPEEDLPQVKLMFYKGSTKARGSGIGLAVCEDIVARHNGKLEISNAQGGGALVTITLPMRN
jgi:signal transduction histidine kinase